MGRVRCAKPITMPSTVHAVADSAGGNGGAQASEWYRTAENGFGTFANRAELSWYTLLRRPCMGSGACITEPPKAWQIPWWPRQTPSNGALNSRMALLERPKSCRSEEHTSELQSPCNL